MFQYEFFSLKDFLRYYVGWMRKIPAMPSCFTKIEDIQWIRSSYWAEHCLECGEPLCYETCPNYQPRGDMRCRLLRYGMYDDPHFKDSFYHAAMRFKKWGKIESIVYPGSFSPEKAKQVHDDWYKKSREKAVLMHLGNYGRKRFPIQERRQFDNEKYRFSGQENASNKQDTADFLLQLYSYEKAPFTLFFDVTDDADLAFRKGITIYPGYNQQCLDMRSLFPPKGRLRAKFYPADNMEASVVFLFCEFVQLKPGVVPLSYPAASSLPADKVKCVAWDLDNTVWDGVLIESDPESLLLRSGVREAMEEMDQRGILQIVISKNSVEDVIPVLQRLGIHHYFVYVFANWGSKSGNLEEASRLLNIGIDTFALIDDSPFERNEVGCYLPAVRTYEAHNPQSILDLPELLVPVTEESRCRRQMYQTDVERKKAADNAKGTNMDFLRSCRMAGTLSTPSTQEELYRSLELLQRTNQLNLSGKKYQEAEFFTHVRSGEKDCFILKCADRFGSYGQVAYLEADVNADTLTISEFAMSCRVAGKYVESALMDSLFRHYGPKHIEKIQLVCKITGRNGLLLDTFQKNGFRQERQGNEILLTVENGQVQNGDIVKINIL